MMRPAFAFVSGRAIEWRFDFNRLWPGLLLSGVIAIASTFIADHRGGPTLLYALLIGMALNTIVGDGRAKAGVDFAKLAKEYSEHVTTKDIGGESIFSRGQMPPEFEAAVMTMKPGQVSEIVTTALGIHIIKFIENIPAKTLEFATMKDKIKDSLLQEATQKSIAPFALELRKEAGVEILPEPK